MIQKAKHGACLKWLHEHAFSWESDECIFYPFPPSHNGYGSVMIDGHAFLAHRYICIVFHGAPNKWANHVAHSCGNKLCMNKRHLRWATRSENEADKVLHGRSNRGERHGHAKLTTHEVKQIRSAPGLYNDIAVAFDVTRQTVSDIKRKKRWAWL